MIGEKLGSNRYWVKDSFIPKYFCMKTNWDKTILIQNFIGSNMNKNNSYPKEFLDLKSVGQRNFLGQQID